MIYLSLAFGKGKKKTEDYMSCSSVFRVFQNMYMITFISSFRNISSQSQYDSELSRISVSIHSFSCPHCGEHSLILNGHYLRRICIAHRSDFLLIKVQRVFCKHCGRTHAIIPDCWLSRSPIPVSLIPDILSLSHSAFSSFQNVYYPLTDHFLYSLKRKISSFFKRFNDFSLDDPILLRNLFFYSPYQHSNDTFFCLDAI